MQSIQFLLSQVSEINKRYSELAKFSGENFNVFEILRLNTDELSHSKIIAELLDPKGAHEVGDKFLEFFLETIGIKEFSTQNATIVLEKFVGQINEANTKGGRIDIVIQEATGRKNIFIENKIYAGDQENQLLRYHNINNKAKLIYLTIWGDEADENSTGKNPDFHHIPVSYSYHIVEWLEKCKKEVVDKPIVRETITQYIHLLKKLTGQSKFKEMEKDVIKTLKGNIDASFIIAENINVLKRSIFEENFKTTMKEIADHFRFEIEFAEKEPSDIEWWVSFKNPAWPSIQLAFAFEMPNNNSMYYGYSHSDAYNPDIPASLQNGIDTFLGSNGWKDNDYWPIYKYMEKHKDWNKETYKDIINGEGEMKSLIEAKIKELLEIWPEYDLSKKS